MTTVAQIVRVAWNSASPQDALRAAVTQGFTIDETRFLIEVVKYLGDQNRISL